MASLTRAQHEKMIAAGVAHLGEVPASLSPALSRYLVFGLEPGAFLCAAIENDLHRAVAYSSPGFPAESFTDLQLLTRWLYNHAPAVCWGSKEKRLAWQRDVAALVPREAPADA